MAASRIVYEGPDLSGPSLARALKVAKDAGLAVHRKKFLPIHFTKKAFARYPAEYRLRKKVREQRQGRLSFRQRIQRMTPEQRRRFNQFIQEKRRPTSSRLSIEEKDQPLVRTGKLRALVLKGGLNFAGTAAARRMELTAPFYLIFNPIGQINKILALQALAPGEEEAFAQEADRELEKFLSKNRK